MMGILKANPNGEVRGRVGANIYSRNRAGAYMRAYATVLQPNTQSQLDAQAAFVYASAGWSALTLIQRGAWEEYAYNSEKFTPSRPRTHGKRTGRAAYISLAMNCYKKNTASTTAAQYLSGEFGGAIGGTKLTYGASAIPPTANLTGNMGMGADVAPIKLSLVQLYGYVVANYIKVQISGDHRLFGLDGTVDEFGHRFGFAVYCSKPCPYVNSRPQVDDFMLIGAIKPITSCTGLGFTASSDFWLFLPWAGVFADYKFPPAPGDIRKFTVYVISEYGLRKRVGSIWHQFIA